MQNVSYIIRPWKKDDYISLTKYADNTNVWNNVRDIFPHPYREEDAKLYIHFANSKPFIEDMAIDVEGEAIGGLGFIRLKDVERLSAEIGYWVGEPFWNKGIATGAVAEFVKYIFANTDIIRLFTSVYEYNTASMRVMEKNGFTKVGIMKHAAIKNNKIIDLHYYEINR
ncbi:MAG: GNAT family N-acetyltransferase [Prevotellaceae bacterium]|jgi:RimJ/RimL family protein N-acetyltransferase|nr:GNAT family N-acetyltransferase [Prevotellaceae bacterium]